MTVTVQHIRLPTGFAMISPKWALLRRRTEVQIAERLPTLGQRPGSERPAYAASSVSTCASDRHRRG
jgi:hypothetical protein